MALKFLNKKGWHTGSLRNIENVWKAEQKHEAEQKKLDELRKQIQEERERSEFRLLQEQAGLVAKQERLDFLYDSGLSVGKGASSSDKGGGGGGGFKALEEALPITNNNNNNNASSSSAKQQSSSSSAPGALFEEAKPHSANDAWRKLHSDPLLLIRQREQQALARVKNNPVQMSIIRKSVEEKKKHKDKSHDKKEAKKKKKKHTSSKHHRHYSKEDVSDDEGEKRTKSSMRSNSEDHYSKTQRDSEDELSERESRKKKKNHYSGSSSSKNNREGSPNGISQPKIARNDYQGRRNHYMSKHDEYASDQRRSNYDTDRKGRGNAYDSSSITVPRESHHKRPNVAPRLSEEERAARLREMQVDAKLHEEQRWKRLKKAEEDDAREDTQARISGGRNFLDAAQKSVYGAEKGGSSTIEESVRRRTHYLQGRSEAGEGNAFRR